MNRRDGFYLIRLLNAYGQNKMMSGYQCAEAQAFEGDDIAEDCRRKEARYERQAGRIQRVFTAKIKSLVGESK